MCQRTILTLETLVLVSPSKPMSASINSTRPRTTLNSSVRTVLFRLTLADSIVETLPSRTSNAIRWSPRGRHVVLATVGSSSKSELDFWDLDFLSEERREGQDWGTGVQLLGTADHYGVTDVEWDPSGRYLATSASAWTHTVRLHPMIPAASFLISFHSSKTATPSGTLRVPSWSSTSRTASSSLSGALARGHS